MEILLSDKVKRDFFQAVAVSTTEWMHQKKANETLEKELEQNSTRTPRALLNKSWKQHPTKQQL